MLYSESKVLWFVYVYRLAQQQEASKLLNSQQVLSPVSSGSSMQRASVARDLTGTLPPAALPPPPVAPALSGGAAVLPSVMGSSASSPSAPPSYNMCGAAVSPPATMGGSVLSPPLLGAAPPLMRGAAAGSAAWPRPAHAASAATANGGNWGALDSLLPALGPTKTPMNRMRAGGAPTAQAQLRQPLLQQQQPDTGPRKHHQQQLSNADIMDLLS